MPKHQTGIEPATPRVVRSKSQYNYCQKHSGEIRGSVFFQNQIEVTELLTT